MFKFDRESQSNKEKYGIDFETAKLWFDPDRIVIQAKLIGEHRFLNIAQINEACWSAIYTIRNENIRIISVK